MQHLLVLKKTHVSVLALATPGLCDDWTAWLSYTLIHSKRDERAILVSFPFYNGNCRGKN